MSTRDDVNRVARDVFGRERPRPGQLEAMEHLTAGRDVLVVLRTGTGDLLHAAHGSGDELA